MNEKLEPFAAANCPRELHLWRQEVGQIRGLINSTDRIRIALVGTTGAGKSTFLNAVLGQEVLPVGVMAPCTAFVTSVRHAPDARCEVQVQFATRQEWQADLKNLVATLRPGEGEEPREGPAEGKRLADAARKRIQAVYGLNRDELPHPEALLRRPLPTEVESIFQANSVETQNFTSTKEMLGYLRQLTRGEGSLWPLVKQVNIVGPYPCLAGGLELVDLPGLNDPNEARVEVTREFLRTAPFVWVIFSMVRGLTDDIQRILYEEKLLRNLVLGGNYHALSLVGTKADDIDTHIADQLGLPEDCSTAELVGAYRSQTVQEARNQLEQMVRDLTSAQEEDATLTRMVQMAREVRVHTTSANAYIKIKKIARLRKDYGLEDENDTGIPGIHEHLATIGEETGTGYNAHTALKRLTQLREEMTFFFRARLQAPTERIEEARTRCQRELQGFCTKLQRVRERADDRFKVHRTQFLDKIQPLFQSSIQGISRSVEGWRGVHWGTLRAIIQRDGMFKSPTTGKTHDFNEDLAEPLLARLPVSWERYFTEDLGRVTDDFVLQVTESGQGFCEKIRLIVEMVLGKPSTGIEGQLAWFQDKVVVLAESAKKQVIGIVQERRQELAAKMPLVAQHHMRPSYQNAKLENGSGMKQRMLGHLEPNALQSAQPIYSTIQKDLLEGLADLELIIVGLLRKLTQSAEEQAHNVAHNANIDVDEAMIDPVIEDLLRTLPESP